MSLSESAKKQPNQTKGFVTRHKAWLLAASIVLVLILIDLTPLGGNIRFYAKWVECGQKPVATAGSGYLNSGAVHHYSPTGLPGPHSSIMYFCTPLEAEQAGYSASPTDYEFPHLKQK